METPMTLLSAPMPSPPPIEIPRPQPVEPQPVEAPPPRIREEWYPEPIWETAKPDQIERNVVIMIFIAFVAGLLLGKIMNPVILKH